jgi:hypothetical protein
MPEAETLGSAGVLDPDFAVFNIGPRTPEAGLGRPAFVVLLVGALALSFFPAVSMPLGCVVWAWDDFRVWRWLKKADPDRVRGKVCSRFYLAWALWKTTLVAVAMMFATIWGQAMSQMVTPQGLNTTPAEFVAVMLVAMLGLPLSSMVTAFAATSALRRSVRVWVGAEARWARDDRTWPPYLARRRGSSSNRVRLMLIVSGITVGVVVLTVSIVVVLSALENVSKSPVPLILATVLLLVGGPIAILVLLENLGRRIIATTASDCWSRCSEDDRPGF